MGLAASIILERSAEPVTFRFRAAEIETPGVKPKVTAKLVVSLAVIRRPPWRTNSWRRSRPAQPRPGRMSSVSSVWARLGVSGVTFQGNGLPYRSEERRVGKE